MVLYGHVGEAAKADTTEHRGVHGMLVYLFRDEHSRDTLAYSTDVTGRNIPRRSPKTQWSFVSAAQIQDDDYEEVRLHLRRWGFYVFRR
jgi:hypothetical protein